MLSTIGPRLLSRRSPGGGVDDETALGAQAEELGEGLVVGPAGRVEGVAFAGAEVRERAVHVPHLFLT